MRHTARWVVVAAWLVAISACGGSEESDDAATPQTETVPDTVRSTETPASTADSDGSTTPVSPVTPGGPTAVEVTIDGRSLAGWCSGDSDEGSPTVVLSSGLGNRGSQLVSIETALKAESRVCSYDRAGLGGSDPAATPQTFTDVVDDLNTFLVQGHIDPPYVLVGHSMGGSIVIRYAQQHAADVAGFVAMNPIPPFTSWIARASEVQSPEELQSMEIDFYEGANDEGIDLRDTDLTIEEPVSDDIPYVVMYAEDCPGDFCDRIRPVLQAATEEFASLGDRGKFIAVPGAGHDLYITNLDDILTEVRALLG